MTDFVRRRWPTRILIALAVLLVAIAVIGPEVRDPSLIIDFERQNQPPSWSSPLGTDALGRDNVARVTGGLRASLLFGFVAALTWGGVCLAVGLVGRMPRRLSRWPWYGWVIDIAVAGITTAVGITLWLEYRETPSPAFERFTAALTLYEATVVLFVMIGVALAVWTSRTRLPLARRIGWVAACLSVLAVLAIHAEPYLARLGISPIQAPTSSLGSLIDERARFHSSEWWLRLSLAGLWIAVVLTLVGAALAVLARLLPASSRPELRAPIYVVLASWAVYLSSTLLQLSVKPIGEWAYWLSTGLAALGIVWCAWAAIRLTSNAPGRWVYVATIICAIPLALDWPFAKGLNYVIPRVF